MFDFLKLNVYQKAKHFYNCTKQMTDNIKVEDYTKDQLSRDAFSINLNIAEGSGKFSKRDRKNFFECVAILDILHDEKKINDQTFQSHLNDAENLSKSLYYMIQNLSQD